VVVLTDAQLDALADRIAERLRAIDDAPCPSEARRLVDALTVAQAIGVSRDCVYAHAEQLGGHRVGNGPRGRLRFDLGQALAAWTACSTGRASEPPGSPPSAGAPDVRRHSRKGSARSLLPMKAPAVALDVDNTTMRSGRASEPL
jgi:hypothetical protein